MKQQLLQYGPVSGIYAYYVYIFVCGHGWPSGCSVMCLCHKTAITGKLTVVSDPIPALWGENHSELTCVDLSSLSHLFPPTFLLSSCIPFFHCFFLWYFLLFFLSHSLSFSFSPAFLSLLFLPASPFFLPLLHVYPCTWHKVVMITGDNPLTACYVAKELGIAPGKRLILTPSPPPSTSSSVTDSTAGGWKWQSVNATKNIPFSSVREEISQLGYTYNLCLTGEVEKAQRP